MKKFAFLIFVALELSAALNVKESERQSPTVHEAPGEMTVADHVSNCVEEALQLQTWGIGRIHIHKGLHWLRSKVIGAVDPMTLALKSKSEDGKQSARQSPNVYQAPGERTLADHVSHEADEVPEDSLKRRMIKLFTVALWQGLFMLIVAWFYVTCKNDNGLKEDYWPKDDDIPGDPLDLKGGDFRHGLFHCCDLPGWACLTCFCPGVRWADNMRIIGQFEFATAIFIWFATEFLGVVLGGLLAWLMLTLLGVRYRQQIRKTFNMQQAGETLCCDCLSWCFCACCSIVQEARQVEAAHKIGFHDTKVLSIFGHVSHVDDHHIMTP